MSSSAIFRLKRHYISFVLFYIRLIEIFAVIILIYVEVILRMNIETTAKYL